MLGIVPGTTVCCRHRERRASLPTPCPALSRWSCWAGHPGTIPQPPWTVSSHHSSCGGGTPGARRGPVLLPGLRVRLPLGSLLGLPLSGWVPLCHDLPKAGRALGVGVSPSGFLLSAGTKWQRRHCRSRPGEAGGSDSPGQPEVRALACPTQHGQTSSISSGADPEGFITISPAGNIPSPALPTCQIPPSRNSVLWIKVRELKEKTPQRLEQAPSLGTGEGFPSVNHLSFISFRLLLQNFVVAVVINLDNSPRQ